MFAGAAGRAADVVEGAASTSASAASASRASRRRRRRAFRSSVQVLSRGRVGVRSGLPPARASAPTEIQAGELRASDPTALQSGAPAHPLFAKFPYQGQHLGVVGDDLWFGWFSALLAAVPGPVLVGGIIAASALLIALRFPCLALRGALLLGASFRLLFFGA